MTTYLLKATTLSPLHIGSGEELRQDFDFKVFQGRTYRLNVESILDKYMNDWQRNPKLLPGSLIKEGDLSNPDLTRYDLKSFPRSSKIDARLQACIKDVYDRPYIPGSSLKGAIRTALAWTGWQEMNINFDRSMVGYKRQWAGQKLEQKIFGVSPNTDLLKALQISDCYGPKNPGEKLMVVNVQVLTASTAGTPVELEAISGDTVFNGSIHIESELFQDSFNRKLGFNNRRHWLNELMPRLQTHSKTRIDELYKWFANNNLHAVAKFYNQLSKVKLPENQALIQLGWGTGWDGKTFWTHIQKDHALFSQLVNDFKMQKTGRSGGYNNAVSEFPRSKRIAMEIKEGRWSAAAPLGWVLLELKPKN
jgi:CRISPR-associated protein Csm5